MMMNCCQTTQEKKSHFLLLLFTFTTVGLKEIVGPMQEIVTYRW
jgi:hypothetical protein